MRKFIQTQEGLDKFAEDLKAHPLGEYGILIEIKSGTRTAKQNSAMHVYFNQLSTALNDAGLDMRTVMKEDAPLPWTPDNVKHNLWFHIMKALTSKTSTTQLERPEVSDIYEALNRHIAQKFGVYVPFPSKFNPPK